MLTEFLQTRQRSPKHLAGSPCSRAYRARVSIILSTLLVLLTCRTRLRGASAARACVHPSPQASSSAHNVVNSRGRRTGLRRKRRGGGQDRPSSGPLRCRSGKRYTSVMHRDSAHPIASPQTRRLAGNRSTATCRGSPQSMRHAGLKCALRGSVSSEQVPQCMSPMGSSTSASC